MDFGVYPVLPHGCIATDWGGRHKLYKLQLVINDSSDCETSEQNFRISLEKLFTGNTVLRFER